MNDLSTETKLRLLKQIRERYHENMLDLNARENIIYGYSDINPSYDDALYGQEDFENQNSVSHSHFKLRILISILLFCCIIFMDKKGIKMVGITSENIFEAISTDYETKVSDIITHYIKKEIDIND